MNGEKYGEEKTLRVLGDVYHFGETYVDKVDIKSKRDQYGKLFLTLHGSFTIKCVSFTYTIEESDITTEEIIHQFIEYISKIWVQLEYYNPKN